MINSNQYHYTRHRMQIGQITFIFSLHDELQSKKPV